MYFIIIILLKNEHYYTGNNIDSNSTLSFINMHIHGFFTQFSIDYEKTSNFVLLKTFLLYIVLRISNTFFNLIKVNI